MGDALSEQAGIDAILLCHFDAEKALDQLLKMSAASSVTKSSKPTIKAKPAPAIQGINIGVQQNISTAMCCNLLQKFFMHFSKKVLMPLAIYLIRYL